MWYVIILHYNVWELMLTMPPLPLNQGCKVDILKTYDRAWLQKNTCFRLRSNMRREHFKRDMN